MTNRLEHVFQYVAKAVWAIEPSVLAVITDLVAARMDGHYFTAAELRERIGDPLERELELEERNAQLAELARGDSSSRRSGGAVALLSLYGIIAPRASMVNDVSGPSGTGMDAFSRNLDLALGDDEISAIVVDINSPGGSADMVLETGQRIRAAREQKPIYMVANTIAFSAAHWLGSQGTEFSVTPSGAVGSIGAYMAHQDLSAKYEAEGRKVTLISAGKYKTEANPFEALTEEAKAHLQEQVDEVYGQFVAEVARGRGIKSSVVRDDFGQGRTVGAKQALASGMVDRIDTLENTVRRALRGQGRPRGARTFAGIDAGELVDDELEPAVVEPASSEPAPTVPSETEVPLDHLQYLSL